MNIHSLDCIFYLYWCIKVYKVPNLSINFLETKKSRSRMGHLAHLQTLPNYLSSSTKINPADTREKQACHYKYFDDELTTLCS